jgi:alpha,alpha-trehalose-phosphate synthase [UDP-forming]
LLPRPHDPSVFGTILDRAAGSFRYSPEDSAVPAHRQYVPGTMVLATTWQTRSGWLAVTDFLAVGPWYRDGVRSERHRRTPGDADARHVLVRSATCLHGRVDVLLRCEPSFEYGQVDAEWAYVGEGYRAVATTNEDQLRLRLAGDLRLGIEGRAIHARHRLQEGESAFVALSWTDDPVPEDHQAVERWRADTNRFWRGWIDRGRFPDHPWREHVQRSALTLKGLTYTPTGALLAAPTTSLPEHPGGTRNWDYRYTWVRDSAFTLWALHALGFDTEADDFLAFLGDVLEARPGGARGERGPLQVLYPVDGTELPPEGELTHLTGYAGSRPVRISNAAASQDQFDILGMLVDCVFQHTKSRDSLSERAWRLVVQAVETALASWRKPDRSIWESRGVPSHHTFSKVMCWVAADRGARLAALRGEVERATSWWEAAAEIHADACEHGVRDDGVFTQRYGDDELDAALLVLPLVRFLPADDERVRATVLAIADELADGAFVYRYRADAVDDGIGGEPEASFTVCSFWLVSALVEIGELELARANCEKLIGAASSLGLYGEELDPATTRHLGNFPQALTHLALINALLHVIEAEQLRERDGRRARRLADLVERGRPGRPSQHDDVTTRSRAAANGAARATGRLVVVANRLPVHRLDRAGPWEPSPGGLAPALTAVLRDHDGIWVGWTGETGPSDAPSMLDGTRLVSVHLSERDYEWFYLGFSNATLWPLYHDAVRTPTYHREWWQSYVTVNRRYADAVAEVAAFGGTVWVHDYQLQLVPQLLRARRPDLRIGFFLHIPFPPRELFLQLPWRRELLAGLLGADLVGFQVNGAASNFARLARRLAGARGTNAELQVDGRSVRVGAFPISVDTEQLTRLAVAPQVRASAARVRAELGDPQTVLLGVDRLDYTKGIDQRVRAVAELFAEGTLTPTRQVMVQVAVPSREDDSHYLAERRQLEQVVSEVNGEHALVGRPAIHYHHQSLPLAELVALYLAADVMLVTPFRDGMNLVAKEYVVCRTDLTGALVLSEFAGAAAELRGAFTVNPHDLEGLKEAIRRAVSVAPKDGRARMLRMRRVVLRHDVHAWAASFLAALERLGRPVAPIPLPAPPGAAASR